VIRQTVSLYSQLTRLPVPQPELLSLDADASLRRD
jgi:hypothetical protein